MLSVPTPVSVICCLLLSGFASAIIRLSQLRCVCRQVRGTVLQLEELQVVVNHIFVASAVFIFDTHQLGSWCVVFRPLPTTRAVMPFVATRTRSPSLNVRYPHCKFNQKSCKMCSSLRGSSRGRFHIRTERLLPVKGSLREVDCLRQAIAWSTSTTRRASLLPCLRGSISRALVSTSAAVTSCLSLIVISDLLHPRVRITKLLNVFTDCSNLTAVELIWFDLSVCLDSSSPQAITLCS